MRSVAYMMAGDEQMIIGQLQHSNGPRDLHSNSSLMRPYLIRLLTERGPTQPRRSIFQFNQASRQVRLSCRVRVRSALGYGSMFFRGSHVSHHCVLFECTRCLKFVAICHRLQGGRPTRSGHRVVMRLLIHPPPMNGLFRVGTA